MHNLRAWPEHAGHSIDPGAQRRVHQMSIAQGRLHLAVAEKLADHFQRGAAADQERSECMAQVMDAYIRQICLALHLYPKPADFLDGLARHIAGEEPWIALGHYKRSLAHDRRDIRRDRHPGGSCAASWSLQALTKSQALD